MLSWQRISLRSKIAGLMSLLVLLAVVALTYLSIQRERINFQQELASQANLLLDTTSLTIRDQLYLVELDELIDIARVVSDNPDVTMFLVYDSGGKILVHSAKPELTFSQIVDPLGQVLVNKSLEPVYLEWQADQLIAGQPVVLGGTPIGAVAIGLSTQPLQQKVVTITQQGILLAVIALFIGGILTLLLARQITNPLVELTEVVARMSNGDLSVRVKQQSQDEIGRLGLAFNQMVTGLQEREWLRDMFGRFVSREVAEAIRGGQLELQGENRIVSVLFCDIRDFTDFSERHSPREVVAMLNEYLPMVIGAAQRHGGMVNKFGGDSTLIIYGAPREMEDSAYQAVLTAVDIRRGLESLNTALQSKGEEPLRVGIGINTGVALAGAVGPIERQEYTVVGNTVNLAARIDELNKQFPDHDILISEWTCDALGHHAQKFEMISLGTIAIRGKNEPVEIWSVKGARTTDQRGNDD